MTDLEKSIYDVIAKADGVSGEEIAAILNVTKNIINLTLASSASLKSLVKQASNYKWYLISSGPSKKPAVDKPKPDEDLRKLCRYYLQCISLEDSSSVSQYLEDRHNNLAYAVLNSLEITLSKHQLCQHIPVVQIPG